MTETRGDKWYKLEFKFVLKDLEQGKQLTEEIIKVMEAKGFTPLYDFEELRIIELGVRERNKAISIEDKPCIFDKTCICLSKDNCAGCKFAEIKTEEIEFLKKATRSFCSECKAIEKLIEKKEEQNTTIRKAESK